MAVNRTASMQTASLFTSIINLTKAIMGAGILGMPFNFAQTGLALGLFALTFFAMAQVLAMHFVALAVIEADGHGQECSLRALTVSAFQRFGLSRVAGLIMSASVVAFAYGCCVSYIIVVGDLLPEVCAFFGVVSFPWLRREFWMTLVGWGILFPLSLFTNMSALKVTSLIGTMGLLYIALAAVSFYLGIIPVQTFSEQTLTIMPPPITQHTTFPGLLEALGIFLFSFGCVTCIPRILLEIDNLNPKRANIVVYASVFNCTLLYALVGLCGVYAFHSGVPGNALMAFPNEPGTVGAYVSIFARLAIAVNVSGSVPLEMHPLRSTFAEILFGKTLQDMQFRNQVLLTVIVFVCTWGLALLCTSLDEAMAFCGSTANMFVGFFFPACFFILGVYVPRDSELGINLPSQEQVAPSTGDVIVIRKQSFVKRSMAWMMAIASMVLMPIITYGVFAKMSEAHAEG